LVSRGEMQKFLHSLVVITESVQCVKNKPGVSLKLNVSSMLLYASVHRTHISGNRLPTLLTL
jgi:hypothetical protein